MRRVIPIVLIRNGGVYKGARFQKHRYLGDPRNTVRIFNDKEVDELIFLDIGASKQESSPDLRLVEEIAEHCYVPFAYGGGIKTISHARSILRAGADRVAINTLAFDDFSYIQRIADEFGSSSLIGAVDYRSSIMGKMKTFDHRRIFQNGQDVLRHCRRLQDSGVGELLLTSVDREGSFQGLDLEFLRIASEAMKIPVIGAGGVGSNQNIVDGFEIGRLSGVGVGSFFVLSGRGGSFLISY